MRALLLCAGHGQRLRPLTDAVAKPALPVLNEPLAGYALGRMAEAGVRQAAVNLHHLPDTVRAALGDGSRWGVRIRYVEEPEILGTGGAVSNLKDWLAGEGTCLVANGDTVADVDLRGALRAHRDSGTDATAVTEPRDPRPGFSAVWAGPGGRLLGFGASPPAADAVPSHFAGFHVLEPAFLRTLPAARAFCLHREGYLPFIAAGGRAGVWAGARGVHDAGTLSRYLDAQADLLSEPARAGRLRGRPLPPPRTPGCFVDADSRLAGDVALSAPALLEGVRAEAGAALGPSVVAGAGSRIGRRARLAHSVVLAGASVPPGFSGDVLVVLPRREGAA